MTKRIYKFDNLKAILIFLVVFGHFLELVEGHKLLYLTIYSFHMPLFLFLSGYFARFDRKKIWNQLICPYVIFQILYTVFEIYVLHAEGLKLTFVRPRWLMWYLFNMIIYYLLIPFLDVAPGRTRLAVVFGMTVAALLSGYDNKLGYEFSAARIFNFMPFFFSGYYLAREKDRTAPAAPPTDRTYLWKKLGFSATAIAVMTGILNTGLISDRMLYGAYSYEAAGYNIFTKIFIFVMAALWIVIAMLMMPDRRIPLLSVVGRYTMPVFLLHGFVVKLAGRYCDVTGETLSFLSALFLSVLIVLLFGNQYMGRLFCRGGWLWQGKG